MILFHHRGILSPKNGGCHGVAPYPCPFQGHALLHELCSRRYQKKSGPPGYRALFYQLKAGGITLMLTARGKMELLVVKKGCRAWTRTTISLFQRQGSSFGRPGNQIGCPGWLRTIDLRVQSAAFYSLNYGAIRWSGRQVMLLLVLAPKASAFAPAMKRQKAEGRRQKVEVRRQKVEVRRQKEKTENRNFRRPDSRASFLLTSDF
jgi:hypothetical protein